MKNDLTHNKFKIELAAISIFDIEILKLGVELKPLVFVDL